MNGHDSIILAAGSNVVTSALDLFSQFAIIGGGLWAVWGVVTLAGGLKDQNGPATQSGVWQVVGVHSEPFDGSGVGGDRKSVV